MNLKNKFWNNIIFAFLAQGISLFLSVLMSLVVPKFLTVRDFGYWQLFIFYFGYVGFFHFGLNDGVYLKYGGKSYDEMDKPLLGSQYKIAAVLQSVMAIIFIFFCFFIIDDNNRKFVILMTGIVMVLNNLSLYLGFIFQAANETKWFSISVILDKLVFMVCLLPMIFIKVNDFRFYIVFYVTGKVAALVYSIYKGKEIVFSKCLPLKITFINMFDNIKIGINLMIANIASTLIIGSARFIIDGRWGIEAFGKFSLSMSIINFVLLFISQVSMVLFPMLRNVNSEQQSVLYKGIRDGLSLFLPLAFLCYAPLCYVMALWLPQYKESLIYLGLLLPICTFNGKMNLLCTTYFKVFRKEKNLLMVNVFAMVLSLILSLLGAYIFDNIIIVAVFLVLSIGIRSYISELYIAKIMNSNIILDIIMETVIVIAFMFSTWRFSLLKSFIIILFVYLVFALINAHKVKRILSFISKGK